MNPIFLKFLLNKYVLGGFAIFLVVGSCFIYYMWSQNKIETLKIQVSQLEKIAEGQKKVIEKQKKDYDDIIASNRNLVEKTEELKTSNRKLSDKLYRETEGKKSLEELALKKSKLIEKLINGGTKDVLRCFELISLGEEC